MADMRRILDKAFETKEFDELADAPVDALEGVSKTDAEALQKALHIRSIRDLATNTYVLRAQAIVHLAHTPAELQAAAEKKAAAAKKPTT